MSVWTYVANGLLAIGLYEIVICILGSSPSITSGIISIILGLMLSLFIEKV